MKPTALRMDKQYIIYYQTWTWVFFTGLLQVNCKKRKIFLKDWSRLWVWCISISASSSVWRTWDQDFIRDIKGTTRVIHTKVRRCSLCTVSKDIKVFVVFSEATRDESYSTISRLESCHCLDLLCGDVPLLSYSQVGLN